MYFPSRSNLHPAIPRPTRSFPNWKLPTGQLHLGDSTTCLQTESPFWVRVSVAASRDGFATASMQAKSGRDDRVDFASRTFNCCYRTMDHKTFLMPISKGRKTGRRVARIFGCVRNELSRLSIWTVDPRVGSYDVSIMLATARVASMKLLSIARLKLSAAFFGSEDGVDCNTAF